MPGKHADSINDSDPVTGSGDENMSENASPRPCLRCCSLAFEHCKFTSRQVTFSCSWISVGQTMCRAPRLTHNLPCIRRKYPEIQILLWQCVHWFAGTGPFQRTAPFKRYEHEGQNHSLTCSAESSHIGCPLCRPMTRGSTRLLSPAPRALAVKAGSMCKVGTITSNYFEL